MNKNIIYEINKQKRILYNLINSKVPYEEIVRQSQILDKIINLYLKNNTKKEFK